MNWWQKRFGRAAGAHTVGAAAAEMRTHSLVQTAGVPRGPAGSWEIQPLLPAEHRLYEQLRAAVPIVDAAILKIVRLVGGFQLTAETEATTRRLQQFAAEVPVGACQAGLDAFLARYLDDLLTYGGAAGEMVLTPEGTDLRALYNSPLEHLEAGTPVCAVEPEFYIHDGLARKPAAAPHLLLYSALNPPAGEMRGVSLLRGLPLIGETLLHIFNCIDKNFERVGNVRFAVTYKPGAQGADPLSARETAQELAREWGTAMNASGGVRDFVAVGDVDVKVIGADNQMIDTKIPVEQLLQQIVSKLGLPPFFLGLSWSTTERMSTQQADLLTSELESYRRLLTPVVLRICRMYLALHGIAEEITLEWDSINLQDEVELAQAQLLTAQAAQLTREL